MRAKWRKKRMRRLSVSEGRCVQGPSKPSPPPGALDITCPGRPSLRWDREARSEDFAGHGCDLLILLSSTEASKQKRGSVFGVNVPDERLKKDLMSGQRYR